MPRDFEGNYYFAGSSRHWHGKEFVASSEFLGTEFNEGRNNGPNAASRARQSALRMALHGVNPGERWWLELLSPETREKLEAFDGGK